MPGSQLQIWPSLISRIACLLPSKRGIVRIIPGVLPLRLAFHRVRPSWLLFPVNSDTARESSDFPHENLAVDAVNLPNFHREKTGTFYLKSPSSKKRIILEETFWTQLRSLDSRVCTQMLSVVFIPALSESN